MPEVNPEIIRWHVCLTVTVDGYWVDMIGVTISKDSPGSDFYHQIHRFQYRHLPKKQNTNQKGSKILNKLLLGWWEFQWRTSIQRLWHRKISRQCMEAEFPYRWIADKAIPAEERGRDRRAVESQAEPWKTSTVRREALAAATEQASPTAGATVPHTQEILALTSSEVLVFCFCQRVCC